MDDQTIKAIELNRKKQRIINNLIIAFYDSDLEDSKDLVLEALEELEELKEQYYGNGVSVVDNEK